jgi:hypothetical protein
MDNMSFSNYLNQAWDLHQKSPEDVVANLNNGLKLAQTASDISDLALLATHVYAEHLGLYQEGLVFILSLKDQISNDDNSKLALKRFESVLNICQNSNFDISYLSESDKCRVFALTASAFAGTNNFLQSAVFFGQAEELATKLTSADVAVRSMAITGNNLACALEEKSNLSDDEKKLMLKAAYAGLHYWKLAGTWLETERAEYRLSQSYFRIRDLISSIKHANQCLTICEDNKAEALEFFFAFEALTKIELEMNQPLRSLEKMKHYFSLLSEGDQQWCGPILKQIQK